MDAIIKKLNIDNKELRKRVINLINLGLTLDEYEMPKYTFSVKKLDFRNDKSTFGFTFCYRRHFSLKSDQLKNGKFNTKSEIEWVFYYYFGDLDISVSFNHPQHGWMSNKRFIFKERV